MICGGGSPSALQRKETVWPTDTDVVLGVTVGRAACECVGRGGGEMGGWEGEGWRVGGDRMCVQVCVN